MVLQEKYLPVLIDFLSELTTEDDFQEMVLCCCEAWDLSSPKPAERARKAIEASIKKQKYEAATLYNRHRNISLDQCYGDSRTPAADFLNLSGANEWD